MHNGKRQVYIKGTGILISDGHYIIRENQFGCRDSKHRDRIGGNWTFPGYTLWHYYTIYRVISDMHWVLRGGKPHWDTSFGRGNLTGMDRVLYHETDLAAADS